MIFISAMYFPPFEPSNYVSLQASNRKKCDMLLTSHEPEAESLRNLKLFMSTWDGSLQPCPASLKNEDIWIFCHFPHPWNPIQLDTGSSLARKGGIHVGKRHLPPAQAPGARGKALTLLRLQTYHREDPMEERVQAV